MKQFNIFTKYIISQFVVLAIFVVSGCALFTIPNVSGALVELLPDTYDNQNNTETYHVNLKIGKGRVCSGGFIRKNVILTSAHCFSDIKINWKTASEVLTVNGEDAEILKMVRDKTDHILIRISGENVFSQDKNIELVQRSTIRQGTNVHFYGNPFGLMTSAYNRGYVSKIKKDSIIYNIRAIPGDSGAFILSEDNKLIAVISKVRILEHPHYPKLIATLGISYKFSFTKKQLNYIFE